LIISVLANLLNYFIILFVVPIVIVDSVHIFASPINNNMNKLKVLSISQEAIEFENGVKLYSNHDQDCCESHELNLQDLTMLDFEDLEFDLSNDNFFKRIPNYGIELIPIHGHSVRIAGHGYNNGYYSSEMELVIEQNGNVVKRYDISDCQTIEG
jgi:hypothetical protein